MILLDFNEMINRTVFCASCGIIKLGRLCPEVFLEKSAGNLIMAAHTSNRMMGFAVRAVGNDFPDFDGILVPAAILQKIAKRKKDTVPLSVSVSGKEVSFHIGSACVSAMALPGDFIRFYRNPEEFPRILPLSITVDRLPLIKALDMVAVMVEPGNPALELCLSAGTLALRYSGDEGSVDTELPCDNCPASQHLGDNVKLSLHVKHFTEIITHIDSERIKIRFDAQNATVAVLPEPERDYYYFLAQRKRADNEK